MWLPSLAQQKLGTLWHPFWIRLQLIYPKATVERAEFQPPIGGAHHTCALAWPSPCLFCSLGECVAAHSLGGNRLTASRLCHCCCGWGHTSEKPANVKNLLSSTLTGHGYMSECQLIPAYIFYSKTWLLLGSSFECGRGAHHTEIVHSYAYNNLL